MSSRDLQSLHRHLSAATAILEKLLNRSPDALSTGMRNPAFFREIATSRTPVLRQSTSSSTRAARLGRPQSGWEFRSVAPPHVVRHWAKHRNKLSLAEAGASPPATI
jgi:hypothetical protein